MKPSALFGDLYALTVVALMRLVRRSARLRTFVVGAIAATAYRLSRHKRLGTLRTLSETLDSDVGSAKMEETVERSFHVFWEDLFCFLPPAGDAETFEGIEVRGLERLQRALNRGKGVILWESTHFGRRNLAKWVLQARGFSLCQVHAEGHFRTLLDWGDCDTRIRNRVIKPFFERCEEEFVAEIVYVPDSGSLAFTRRLRHRLTGGSILCSAGDGPGGQKRIPVEYLGRTKMFSTGMVSLSRISGAPILPVFCIREAEGLCVIIEKSLPVPRDRESKAVAQETLAEYARVLESYVRSDPGEYRNWHLLGED